MTDRIENRRFVLLDSRMIRGRLVFAAAAIAVLLEASALLAQPTPEPPLADGLTLPTEVRGEPHKLAAIRAETVGKTVVWRVPQGVSWEACDGGKRLVCTAPPGRYPILVATAIGDRPVLADTVLIVSGTPGPGPAPGPGPGPSPTPDAMQDAIRREFAKNVTPERKRDAAKLASLYRLAVAESENPAHKSCVELIDTIRAAADLMKFESPTHLEIKRGIVADELATIAEETAPLTDGLRAKIAAVYKRAATVLEELSK